MADVGSLFCNKVLQKQSAQKNESLEWLDFVSSISNFCWILCTCHYGIGDMGYVAFWMMPKGNEKRETQQNTLLYRWQEAKKATKKGKPSKIRCLYRRQEAKKATKIEEIPEIRCPTHAFPKKVRSEKAATPKRPQTTGQPHLGAAALFYILSAITADHIFSKSSEFFRMDPTSLRWMNRGSKC